MRLDAELIHISALFNQEVFNTLLPVINNFPWVTEIGKVLFENVKSLSDYNDLTIASKLSSIVIPEEIDALLNSIHIMKGITSTNEIESLSLALYKYYKIRKTHEYVTKYKDDIDQLVKHIKTIPDSVTSSVQIVTLGKLDPLVVMDEEIGGLDNVLPTNFKVIKDATPFKGYLKGQIIQFVGSPGKGKSALMLYEVTLMAIHGHKILWIALGDLMKYDFISRFTTILSGIEYYKVALDPNKYFTEEVKEVANNIDLITVPAGRLTSEELINIVETSKTDYEVIVIDYDSNFKIENENSYQQGGDTYNDLTEIARPTNGKRARLVFIASQPKIHYWNELRIPMDGAGESSRKQHIVDMMITLGTANADMPAGIMFLAKVRRGTPNGETGFYMDASGRFFEIDTNQLALMRRF